MASIGDLTYTEWFIGKSDKAVGNFIIYDFNN